jgi:hypothetical protein
MTEIEIVKISPILSDHEVIALTGQESFLMTAGGWFGRPTPNPLWCFGLRHCLKNG